MELRRRLPYNNNYLSGTINFSNDEDHIPVAEFLEGLKDENWASQVSRSIDNLRVKEAL